MVRAISGKARLLQIGFDDADAAQAGLDRLGTSHVEPLLDVLARTADPDLALTSLVRLVEALGEGDPVLAELAADVESDGDVALRLLSVLGASEALADHLVHHPQDWRELADPGLATTRMPAYFLRAELLRAVGADPAAQVPVATHSDDEAMSALRVGYRRLLLRIAARDLAHGARMDDVAAELSDLATGALDAGLAIARARVPEADQVRFCVIGMGKCGARELNYISDVDVIFVHEPADGVDDNRALRIANRLASQLMRICSDHTDEGSLWEVDAALRPEGRSGSLSRTLAGHVGYYERWASTWEFQALLKARPVAGDRALGEEYVAALSPMVWEASERDGFVTDTQRMRRRVVDNIPSKDADRELKLGEGGLRDVEFAVQLLQLVHGKADPALRAPATLSALAELTRGGYIGRADGESLHDAYSFLRTLEHRIQLYALRRTHMVPRDEESLRRLARSMGLWKDPAAALEKEWARQRLEVRRLHQKLFYRPLLSAVAELPSGERALSPEAAKVRLTALGYEDPQAALRHLEALTAGVSRRATVQRTLLPVMLQWFAEGPDPDAGLWGFRRISEALGTTPWYLRALRDEGLIAERLARVLSSSRYTTDLLEREPEGVRLLGEELVPHTAEVLRQQMLGAGGRRESAENAVLAIRAIRRRELFRISAGELLGEIDVAEVGAGLARVTSATIEASLQAIMAEETERRGLDAAPARIAIVAMGRYGGAELSYASDADVMFVYAAADGVPTETAAAFAKAVVAELRRLLGLAGPDLALSLDADLRPEGRNGPLVRTLPAYASYYRSWSHVWEAQALLRADAVVGDTELRAEFTALIDPLRYPAEGLSEDEVREIRRIKGRVDSERLPRGADPRTHLKLGPGGLADIEWTIQLLQLRFAHRVEGLRTPRTLEALDAAREAELIGEADAKKLARAWRLTSRVRNAVTLARGKSSDTLPSNAVERAAVAAILGYPMGSTGEMVNDYLRATRRARGVVDRVFWE